MHTAPESVSRHGSSGARREGTGICLPKCKALVAATAAPASPPPFQTDFAPPASDSVPPLPCPPPPDPPHDAHPAAATASAPRLPSPEHDEGAEEGGKAEEKKKRVTIMEVDDE